MSRKWKTNCIAAGGLALLGIVLWMIPGVRFSACLSFALAGLSIVWLLLGFWAERSGVGRWCSRVFAVGICAVTLILGALETNVIMAAKRDLSAISADSVVILGAGVNGTTPSLTLRTRLETALDYLQRNPDIPVVLSGGQGSGERITEARCMADWLTERGVDAERLILEEESTSTAENFTFSKRKLEEAGIDVETALVAYVTNDFHIYRAGYLASKEGYELAFGIPAKLPWLHLEANYYLREAFALVKTLIFD